MTSTDSETKMIEWVQNALYAELRSMPLWTLSAFGTLKKGDILRQYDSRYKLLVYLCKRHIDKVPIDCYDDNYYCIWHVQEYVPAVKRAVEDIQEGKE